MHPKEGFVAIYLGESGGSCEDMSYLLEGWGLVILMDDCLAQVFGVKAYPQLAICLFGVCQAADPLCGLSLFDDDSCWTTSVSSFSISSFYLMGTFCLPCWTGGTVGSVLMSYLPCMSPMQSKLLGNYA